MAGGPELTYLACAAFATPNSSSGISWDDGSTSTLKTLVSAAHNSGKGTKVVLSIGGCFVLALH